MDVESAMRVNELAKELSKKGFADSSEDASRMAEQFLQKSIVHKDNIAQPEGSDKFEIQIERFQRKFNSDLSGMQDKLNSVISNMNLICDEIQRLKTREPVRQEVNTEAPKQGKQEKIGAKETKKEYPPRTGKFRPGDIDINEVFYCGTK